MLGLALILVALIALAGFLFRHGRDMLGLISAFLSLVCVFIVMPFPADFFIAWVLIAIGGILLLGIASHATGSGSVDHYWEDSRGNVHADTVSDEKERLRERVRAGDYSESAYRLRSLERSESAAGALPLIFAGGWLLITALVVFLNHNWRWAIGYLVFGIVTFILLFIFLVPILEFFQRLLTKRGKP